MKSRINRTATTIVLILVSYLLLPAQDVINDSVPVPGQWSKEKIKMV